MNKLIEKIKEFWHFVTNDIWRINRNEVDKSRLFLYNIIKTIIQAGKGYYNNKLGVVASALTYSIVFAFVPLLAMLVSIAKGFGLENSIEDALYNIFKAQPDLVPTLMEFVQKYLDSMNNGLFIGIGVIILMVSVMNLFIRVEDSLNDIWKVKKSRSIFKQFTIYFTGLFLVPILLAVASGASIYLNAIFSKSYLFELISPFMKFLVRLAPYVASWLIFAVMYMIFPNTKVKFGNALIAGMVAGTAYQVFQLLYINGQINLTRYNAVYGGFAALPLFLFFVNMSCMFFLVGAEICYAAQNLRNFDYDIDTDRISNRYERYLTIFVLYIIVKRFEKSEPAFTSEQIMEKYKMPIRILNNIINHLQEADLIISSVNDKGVKTYYPASDINQLTLKNVYKKLDNEGSEFFIHFDNKEIDEFWAHLKEIQKKNEVVLENTKLMDM